MAFAAVLRDLTSRTVVAETLRKRHIRPAAEALEAGETERTLPERRIDPGNKKPAFAP
jgi:hypothetical protein